MDFFTDKISRLFNECDPVTPLPRKIIPTTFKGFRIPQVTTPLARPKSAEIRVREIRALNEISPADSALFQGALETHRCVEDQDLHLFNVKKIFTEKFNKIHNVINLRIPCIMVAKERLKFFVDQVMKKRNDSAYHHRVQLISNKRDRKALEGEKAFRDNLAAIHFQKSDERRYPYK